MTSAYRMIRGSAARAPETPQHLHPPLREAWIREYTHVIWNMPKVADGRVYLYRNPRLLCLDEANPRKVLWELKKPFGPSAIQDGQMLSWNEGKLHLLDVLTGRVLRSGSVPVGNYDCVVDGIVVGDGSVGLFAARLTDLKLLWLHKPPCRITSIFCANTEAVFFGLEDGTVKALGLQDGRELWTYTLEDGPQWHPQAQGFMCLFEDRVITRLLGGRVMAFQAQSGKVVWDFRYEHGFQDGYLYGDRYYLVSPFGQYRVLDARTGRVLVKADLRKGLPGKLASLYDFYPLLISETHAWAGVGPGYVMAFERDTGKYSWHHHPKGAGSFQRQTYFMTCNGRFYYADMSFRLYCLEEENPTDSVLAEQRAAGQSKARRAKPGLGAPRDTETEGEEGLGFTIVDSQERRSLTKRTPYYAAGGDLTVLRCRVSNATFLLGVRGGKKGKVPLSSGEGHLWAPTVADGEHLLESVRAAFGGGRAKAKPAVRVKPPTPMSVTFLGEAGGWVKMKWTGEEGSPEFFVSWSKKEMRGVVAEKDEAYRKDLIDLFASLVVRS